MNGIQESMPTISRFAEAKIVKDKGRIWVDGLAEDLYACYKRKILPSEWGLSWARRGECVDLHAYKYFPGGIPPQGE
jgi:hypothetical protein